MVRRVSVVIILIFVTVLIAYPVGIWVVRDQIVSPEKIENVIKIAKEVGATRLYVQVVWRADAYYESDILPRAEALEGQPKDFDPLAYVLKLARSENLKISAWINACYAWNFVTRPKSPEHVINKHPEWVTYDQNGVSMLNYTGSESLDVPGIFLEPGLPEVRDFIASIAEEIASKYDVDEIHLDYIRYPFRTFGYHPEVQKAYRKWLIRALKEKRVKNLASAFDDYRREQVSLLVKEIYDRVTSHGKRLSAAVLAYYEQDAYEQRFQAWLEWLKGGYLDYAVMMAYDPYPETVKHYVLYALDRLGNLENVRIGLGAYKVVEEPQKLRDLVDSVLYLNPDEIVIFSIASLMESKEMQKIVRGISR
ncbi:glycoside hydrolase family 10 protein [Kosmotoga olearia]|uniref:Glycosyl hydrolase-like 10 domain-containing protein n=1 Tax=Kosmotoga olearia (strain ATCC BAA-1733 / DSM 21960 / TBF 19.5.1) TaxID=521045 RepID=C5CH72_KOSOT|nr:family 10 glycosylhydrolase [Kosmotoga olearia]ACR80675.1 protein of unknown function DUF187 [Kosmotoga olearia TBF 19.5.1]MDI3495358.1 hypothetical protein [Pseudothermotoga sp.]OAA19124.1 hypothetical protein DU53_10895 [Kosmotoga sp. DU53]